MDDNPLAELFNPAEKSMGTDMYQAQVEAVRAQTRLAESHIERDEAREKYKGSLTLIALAALLPFYVLALVYAVMWVF